MNWHETPVKKYLSGLTYASENENEFRSGYVGIEPFIPTADELSMLQELITEQTKSMWLPMERDLALSPNPFELVSEWLNRDIKYHFEKEYLQNDFTLIHCPYRRGMSEDEKNSVRLGIIESLVEDAVMSNVVESLKKWLNQPRESESVPIADKLKWVASSSAMGHIMYELADKGYIQPPRKSNGEIHYEAFAELLSKAFSGVKNSNFLAKTLSPDNEKGLSDNNKERFKIPDVKEIS